MTNEQRQNLFNYFAQEYNVQLLSGDFNEIERIVTPKNVSTENTIEAARKCIFNRLVRLGESTLTQPVGIHFDAVIELMIAYAELVSWPQWIDVNERLPQNNLPVLTIYSYYDELTFAAVLIYDYEVKEWFYYNINKQCMFNVTHWMPLPKPPEHRT